MGRVFPPAAVRHAPFTHTFHALSAIREELLPASGSAAGARVSGNFPPPSRSFTLTYRSGAGVFSHGRVGVAVTRAARADAVWHRARVGEEVRGGSPTGPVL